MNRRKIILSIIVNVITLWLSLPAFPLSYVWTSIDYPGAKGTSAHGIDSNNIVGSYVTNTGKKYGYVYNYKDLTWKSLDAPNARLTEPYDIYGNKIVGWYWDNLWRTFGFIYDTTTNQWTSLYYQGPWAGTQFTGIDGNLIVGSVGAFYDPSVPVYRKVGLIYNGTNWTILRYSGSNDKSETMFNGIDGDYIVGEYVNGRHYGVVYNISTDSWLLLDYPGSEGTRALGISGDKVVGQYWSAGADHGFIYSLSTQEWSRFDHPNGYYTTTWGIDGENIVGIYQNAHGFLAAPAPEPSPVPEPSSVVLFITGSGLLGLSLRLMKLKKSLSDRQ